MTDMAGLRAFAWKLLYTCIAAIVLRSNVKLAAAQPITRAVVHRRVERPLRNSMLEPSVYAVGRSRCAHPTIANVYPPRLAPYREKRLGLE